MPSTIRRFVPLSALLLLLTAGCASTSQNGDAPTSTTSTTVAVESSVADETASSDGASTTGSVASSTLSACADLIDGAELVHPSNDDAPLADLDGDGTDDEFWVTTSSELQVVRSSDGAVSAPLASGVPFGLFDAVLAGADIDGDGLDEIFYSIGGNTAITGIVLELDGCDLRSIGTDDEDLGFDGLFAYVYFAGGNGCAPTGCYYSVSCSGGDGEAIEIVLTSIFPTISVLDPAFDESMLSQPIDDLEVTFGQMIATVADGAATVVGATEPVSMALSEAEEWTSLPEVSCDV